MFADRLLKVENAGNGKTAIITPGLGATYDQIILLLGGGLAPVDITEVRCFANDVEFFKDTGPALVLRQDYLGIDQDDGELVIDFTEPKARGGAAEQLMSSIPANLLKKFRIEVDIAANQGGGEDFSNLKALALFRGPTKNPFILKRRKFTYAAAAAADHDLFLPAGAASGGIIKRIWLHEGDAVTAALLKVGGFVAQDWKTIAELERTQKRYEKVPQAGLVVLDFVVDGNLQGALNTAQLPGGQGAPDALLRLTTNAAQVITGYIDYIDPINKLR